MLNPDNYDPAKDPIARGRTPSRVEVHPAYRGGEVYSVTFEGDGGEKHACYGVTSQGQVMDACVLQSMFFVDGDLDGSAISTMSFVVDSMEKSGKVKNDNSVSNVQGEGSENE